MTARVTIFAEQAIREALRISTPQRVEIANEIAAEAAATETVLTGRLQSSYGVEVSGDTVRAVNDDPTAGFKVFGTGDTPPHPGFIDAARKRGKYSGMTPKRG
jgi:hypothetical protein